MRCYLLRSQNLANKSRNIKIDLMQDRHTGYFSQAMKEAYTKCKEDFGKSFHLEVMLLR